MVLKFLSVCSYFIRCSEIVTSIPTDPTPADHTLQTNEQSFAQTIDQVMYDQTVTKLQLVDLNYVKLAGMFKVNQTHENPNCANLLFGSYCERYYSHFVLMGLSKLESKQQVVSDLQLVLEHGFYSSQDWLSIHTAYAVVANIDKW